MEPQGRAAGRRGRVAAQDSELGATPSWSFIGFDGKMQKCLQKDRSAASFRDPFGFERLPINRCLNAAIDGGSRTL